MPIASLHEPSSKNGNPPDPREQISTTIGIEPGAQASPSGRHAKGRLLSNSDRCGDAVWPLGFWKRYGLLLLQAHPWNHERVHRVYCALGLNLPRRTVRRVPGRVRPPLDAPPVMIQTGALDCVSDTLHDRRRGRALTVLDEGNRESLDIAVGESARGAGAGGARDRVRHSLGGAASTTAPSFSRSRLSTGRPVIGSPSTTFSRASRIKTPSSSALTAATRPRCSTLTSSTRFAELQAVTDPWLRSYNQERPHDSLGRKPPLMLLPRPTPPAQSPNKVSA